MTEQLADWERELFAQQPEPADAAERPETDPTPSTVTPAPPAVDPVEPTGPVIEVAEIDGEVDLGDVGHEGLPAHPIGAAERLVELAGHGDGGVLLRLAATVRSVTHRADGAVTWTWTVISPAQWAKNGPGDEQETVLQVRAESSGGTWSDRAWSLTARLTVVTDDWGATQVWPVLYTGSITAGSRADPAVATRFHDGDRGDGNRRGGAVLGHMIARWFHDHIARRGLVHLAGQVDLDGAIEAHVAAETALYKAMRAARERGLSANEIARRTAGLMSRPVALDILSALKLEEDARRALDEAGLGDGVNVSVTRRRVVQIQLSDEPAANDGASGVEAALEAAGIWLSGTDDETSGPFAGKAIGELYID